MKENKEDRVRKTPTSQVLISTRVRNSEDHGSNSPTAQGSAQATGSNTILSAPLVASAPKGFFEGTSFSFLHTLWEET